MKLHHLSAAVQNAQRLSASNVSAKVRAGWVWHRLTSSFAAAAGTATYSRALVSPIGEIAFVSDRAEGPVSSDALPALDIEYTLVKLSVPFEEKDAAKRLGAFWVSHLKTWACAPDRTSEFGKWIADQPEIFDLLANDSTPTNQA